MTKIQTPQGEINILKPDSGMLQKLQNLLTYGVMPFKKTFNGADYGIGMQCDEQELLCLKLQPIEVEINQAEQLFQLQHIMIMEAYAKYLQIGFKGAYLASPYLRQRDNGLWESGIANFIFPAENETNSSEPGISVAYDDQLGKGVTQMFMAFVENYKLTFMEINKPMPPYFGIDIRPRSHLQNLAMYFMTLGPDVICLRPNLREQEDMAWEILAKHGIDKVYHLPAMPMTIDQSTLDTSKGKL